MSIFENLQKAKDTTPKNLTDAEKKTETEQTTPKTHNGITELVFILDRSGSMGGLESDTIGGFNSMLEKQKQQEGKAYVTTVLFDHEIELLHSRENLHDIKPLTDKDYTVRGMTALIDAIGFSINRIKSLHEELKDEKVPENTLFVITTDGLENASKKYSSSEVKKMIEEQKKKGWEFLFVGANIDAVETARSFGIAPERAVNYHSDHKGTKVFYNSMSGFVSKMRAGKGIDASWCAEINEDYQNRKKE